MEKDKEKSRNYQREYYKKNKEKVATSSKRQSKEKLEYIKSIKKDLQCCVCGESSIEVLDFHHRNALEKDYTISTMAHRRFSKKRILEEINKCDVYCANCHRKLHYKELHHGIMA